MGLTISSLLTRLFGKKQMRILMGMFSREVQTLVISLIIALWHATQMRNDEFIYLKMSIAIQL